MKKVLFIAYHFPPHASTGSSVRSEKFVKYLPDFDWEPTVISLLDRKYQSSSEIYSGVIRATSFLPFTRPYNIMPYGWGSRMYSAVCRVLEREKYDLVYMTAPPFSPIVFARLLKQRFDIPLALDFRDAWSMNPYGERSLLGRILGKYFVPHAEKFALVGANLFINVCPSAEKEYLKRYPFMSGRTEMIPNGFDEADFSGLDAEPSGKKFTLLFTGSFELAAREPDSIFAAMKIVSSSNLPIRFRIVGDVSESLKDARRRAGVEECVKLHPMVEHREAIKEMFNANVLVAYVEGGSSKVSPIGAKTYEYLRTSRPILLIGSSEDLVSLVEKYAPEARFARSDNPQEIADAILSLYEVWQSGELNNVSSTYEEYINRYNRKYLTSRLAYCFDKLLD